MQCRRPQFDPLGWEDSLGKEIAIHSSILAWREVGTAYTWEALTQELCPQHIDNG